MRLTLRRFTTRRDVLYTAAAFVGGLLMLAVHGYTTWDRSFAPPVAWRVLPLAGLCVGMLFRRTAPVTGLVISSVANLADVLMGPSLGSAVVYTDALYAASVYGPRRLTPWLLRLAVGASLLAAVVLGVLSGDVRLAVVIGAVAGTTWVSPVLTGMIVVEHGDKARAEHQRAEQMARLAELDRRTAVNAERARMARELHDVIANHLSAVALHSSAVLKVPDLDRAGIERAMEVIRENSVQGLAEMRRMIGLLREGDDAAPDAAASPRLAGLDRLVAHTARSDLSAALRVEGSAPELPAAVELAAFRIVQESLTNALKHAGPGRAEVLLEYRPDRVVVTVDSPLGRDGPRLPGSGAGLIGMRERASVLAGDFAAGPAGDRWRVHAELPVEPDGRGRT
ncbi:sensor histidine kinase [Actinomadura hibisca]|uniref:sensor histidine kinase n=1 Tax=Actinomadura hibisca TaxID=68565 RepID=UPI00083016AE|nr:histidine kinase [Actinomadura hibisca]